ncbi:hypothetical protein Ctob_000765 [Chrysochromulina tobinii]|uniref:Uncharacterized protein n=1 Tax=Chrysochromulina tobinii TaxID=1460289 RepID=A0A0M0JB64_9EUKA|nr:hypothetical protein Ctob_000765 [Chrysochromulina tobinii]|eukprot:KOO23834.1 hypothetical protein Ctob_000765 [Chrysochromulina sp. CCMP291]
MPREEREEARERLYRSSSPPRSKTPTNLGHMLDTGEMAIASPFKVEVARELPKPRLRARSAPIPKDEATWMGLGGRKGQPAVLPTSGEKPPPESTVASVDGSGILLDENWEETEGAKNGAERSSRPQVRPQPAYQSLTARAYFQDAGWKPGDSYAKYKPAKHPAEWANLDGFARMSRSYEIHHMNTFADITAFSSASSPIVNMIETEQKAPSFLDRMRGVIVKTESKKEVEPVVEDSKSMMQKVKDAGVAGIISYIFWEWAFWGVSVPVSLFGFYEVTGHYPDFSNSEDLQKLGAEAFAFVNVARFAVPLRIGLALGTTPWVQENIVNKFQKKDA